MLQPLVPKLGENNIGKISEMEKIGRIKRVKKMERVRKVEKAIGEIR